MPIEACPSRERLITLKLSRYADDFFSDFKERIPLKVWDRDNKVWLVPERYLQEVESLAEEHGIAFSFEEPVSVRSRAPGDPYAVLGIVPGAPVAVIKAAHKALALENHPDLGHKQSINAAFDRIRKQRGF